jgi:hypothetical protein
MASTTPHLLTLPREVRDEIYSYLHHTLEMEVKLSVAEQEYGFYEPAAVHLENAPYLAVLCTHSRMYEEYNESCFKNLSMCIQSRWDGERLDMTHNDEYYEYEFLQALAHTRHLQIDLSGFEKSDVEGFIIWCHQNLFGSLKAIRSLRVTRSVGSKDVHECCLKKLLRKPLRSIEKLHRLELLSPPPKLAGLPLTRHGDGLRIGAFWTNWVMNDSTWDHSIEHVEVCHYGRSMRNKAVWRIHEYDEPSGFEFEYGAWRLEKYSEEERKVILDRAHKMYEWEERL